MKESEIIFFPAPSLGRRLPQGVRELKRKKLRSENKTSFFPPAPMCELSHWSLSGLLISQTHNAAVVSRGCLYGTTSTN